jgi:hypothetical protein
MNDEIAADIMSDSMIQASLESAFTYPDLKILCLKCGESVIGAEFPPHLQQHISGSEPPPNHWEAL